MITSFTRGHQIVFRNNEWLYADNLQSVKNYGRPCKKCNEFPNESGHDSCLGNLEDVKYACCGHGVQEPFMKKN